MNGFMDGIGTLVVLGMAMMFLLVLSVPIGSLWVLAWLAEPRLAGIVWTLWYGFDAVWALIIIGFFGSALFLPYRAPGGWGWW